MCRYGPSSLRVTSGILWTTTLAQGTAAPPRTLGQKEHGNRVDNQDQNPHGRDVERKIRREKTLHLASRESRSKHLDNGRGGFRKLVRHGQEESNAKDPREDDKEVEWDLPRHPQSDSNIHANAPGCPNHHKGNHDPPGFRLRETCGAQLILVTSGEIPCRAFAAPESSLTLGASGNALSCTQTGGLYLTWETSDLGERALLVVARLALCQLPTGAHHAVCARYTLRESTTLGNIMVSRHALAVVRRHINVLAFVARDMRVEGTRRARRSRVGRVVTKAGGVATHAWTKQCFRRSVLSSLSARYQESDHSHNIIKENLRRGLGPDFEQPSLLLVGVCRDHILRTALSGGVPRFLYKEGLVRTVLPLNTEVRKGTGARS